MTYSPIAAIIFRDLLQGKKNLWTNLYNPKRTPTVKQLAKKFRDYSGEFFGGVVKNALQ